MNPFRKDANSLKIEIDSIEARVVSLRRELEVLREDLRGFECDGYEHFKRVVVPKELDRLAHLRMTIPPGDTAAHERITGQYNEAVAMAKLPESVGQRIRVIEGDLRELTERGDKLKRQLEAATNA